MFITTRPYSVCYITVDSLEESKEIVSKLEKLIRSNPADVFEFNFTELKFSFESRADGTGIVPKKNPYVIEVHGDGGQTDDFFSKLLYSSLR